MARAIVLEPARRAFAARAAGPLVTFAEGGAALLLEAPAAGGASEAPAAIAGTAARGPLVGAGREALHLYGAALAIGDRAAALHLAVLGDAAARPGAGGAEFVAHLGLGCAGGPGRGALGPVLRHAGGEAVGGVRLLLDLALHHGPLEIGSRGGGELGADLLLEHAGAHLVDAALGDFAELERPIGYADEPVHLEPEGAEHVAHLAVLALAQGDRDPGVGALDAVQLGLDRAVLHAVHSDALDERVELGLVDLAIGAHAVAAQPAGFGQLQHAGEAAVVGEQQQAF